MLTIARTAENSTPVSPRVESRSASVVTSRANVSAGKSTSRRQIGARSDALLGLQSALDFLGVGADLFAEGADLVYEGHGRGQKGIDSMFRHFGRLYAHPHDFVGERRKQGRDLVAVVGGLQADYDAIGLGENLDRATEPRFSGP